MKVRGSVVKTIDTFVADHHEDTYTEWLSKLKPDTISIMTQAQNQQWYPVREAVLEPTRIMCRMFYENEKEGAWLSGKYSAKLALRGLYKVFVAVSTPSFLMKRASRVLSTFYNPSAIQVVGNTSKSIDIHLTVLPINDPIIEYRIAGWMEGALEICGCKGLSIEMPQALSKGDTLTECLITWQ